MNRRQKRALLKANLDQIEIKQKGVGRAQAKAFITLAKIIDERYSETGVPDDEIQLLIDGKHEDENLQAAFKDYKEAKHAGVYLSMMKKELKTNGMPDKPETKQEVLGVDVSKD